MKHRWFVGNVTRALGAVMFMSVIALGSSPVRADGDLNNVKHIIIVMQENRSFDHYFGQLPFVAGSPYHSAKGSGKKRACAATDNTCVDGLSCSIVKKTGLLKCKNKNKDNDKSKVVSFHDPRYCTGPDLDHSWYGTHKEVNFSKPNDTLKKSKSDGFVLQNDASDQPDTGGETAADDDTMGYYTDADLPFYYGLAETFAISDRYFASVLGQTFPNRSYFLAGTSFGHLTTSEILTIPAYKPITGTIFDKLDAHGISWTDYYADFAYSFVFRGSSTHQHLVSTFAADATAGTLPAVSFIDPSITADQLINGTLYENDEHPPANVRAGQYFVSTITAALRNSPSWKDSILIITYDEHGGFYDHAIPPAAVRPDMIEPGQCADNSSPPASTQPGGGVNCAHSSGTDAPALCPPCVGKATKACGFTPTGPYPATCANFAQLGVRLPFIAVSPFAKHQYVSHTVGDHTSLLALIEKRFLNGDSIAARDAVANTLEDMFDFDTSPSLNTTVPSAPLPTATDPGCPFVP